MPLAITQTAAGIRFGLKVVPGASRDRIVGLLGDVLKVAVSKPPSGGAANEAVIALLAGSLGVGERSVTITAGHSSPRKQVEVRGVTPEQLRAAFTV